jgi:IclR family pca regulon transcriptional regulator
MDFAKKSASASMTHRASPIPRAANGSRPPSVGSRFPAHATSTGRVLLSGLSSDRLERYFRAATLEVLTEKTVVRPAKLRQLIEECRRAGYAAVEDELAYGVTAVDVPVFDRERRIVASLNISSHSHRITKSKLLRDRLGMLRDVSRQITADLAIVPGLSLGAEV